MKNIFSFIISLLPVLGVAQNSQPFLIKCKLGDLNAPAKAYLVYQLGANRVIDSSAIVNGRCNFNGNLISPTSAFLVLDHKGEGFNKLNNSADVLSFYIDKGDILLSSPDSVSKAQITGSKINDDNKKLMGQLKPLIEQAQKLKNQQDAASPAQQNTAEFQNLMQAKHKDLQLAQKGVLKHFISTNPDSFLSLLALNSVSGPSPNPAELDSLYNSLSKNIKDTETARVFKKSLDGLRNTAVGVTAPDFSQADVNGVPVKLSSFRGKYVLVDFWASWCGPCRQENPNVVKIYNKYKTKNFTVLGVSLDKAEGRSAWLAAIKNDGLTWTQVSDLKFWNNQVAQLYAITSIPSNFLVDPSGKIIAKDLRGDDLENKLKEVLGKM